MIVWIGVVVCVLSAAGTGFLTRLCWRYRQQAEDALRETRALRAQQIYLTKPDLQVAVGVHEVFKRIAEREGPTTGSGRRGPYCKLCRDYGCDHPHTGRPAPVKRVCPGPEVPAADIPEDCCEELPCKGITKRGEIIYGPFG